MTRIAAPDSVLEAVHCACKQGKCERGRCSCLSSKLSSTDLCRCKNCENINKATDEVAIEDDGSDESLGLKHD